MTSFSICVPYTQSSSYDQARSRLEAFSREPNSASAGMTVVCEAAKDPILILNLVGGAGPYHRSFAPVKIQFLKAVLMMLEKKSNTLRNRSMPGLLRRRRLFVSRDRAEYIRYDVTPACTDSPCFPVYTPSTTRVSISLYFVHLHVN